MLELSTHNNELLVNFASSEAESVQMALQNPGVVEDKQSWRIVLNGIYMILSTCFVIASLIALFVLLP